MTWIDTTKNAKKSKTSKVEWVGFVWAFICSFLAWHVSRQEAPEAHQADTSVKRPQHLFFWDRIMTKSSRAALPLTLKTLHIHLDVLSSLWQLQTDSSEVMQCHVFGRACVCVHAYKFLSTWKIHLDPTVKSIDLLKVCVAFWSVKVGKSDRCRGWQRRKRKTEGDTDRETERDIHRERKAKGEMGW